MFKKNNPKIMVLMPVWQVNFETRFFRLVKILRERGLEVNFCVCTQEMNKRKELHLPALPKERLSLPHFSNMEVTAVNSLEELFEYILAANLIIRGTGKGVEEISKLISLAGVSTPTIQIEDRG